MAGLTAWTEAWDGGVTVAVDGNDDARAVRAIWLCKCDDWAEFECIFENCCCCCELEFEGEFVERVEEEAGE